MMSYYSHRHRSPSNSSTSSTGSNKSYNTPGSTSSVSSTNSSSSSSSRSSISPRNSIVGRRMSFSASAFTADNIQLQPTASESSLEVSTLASESDDSDGRLQFLPTVLLTPNNNNANNSSNNSTVKNNFEHSRPQHHNDEERLLMLAKHPNATEDQIRLALYQKERSKLAKERKYRARPEEHESPTSNRPQIQQEQKQQVVRFSTSGPVDADTGEAWTRPLNNNAAVSHDCHGGDQHRIAKQTSFDQAWDDVENQASQPSSPQKGFSFWRLLTRIGPVQEIQQSSSTGSVVPPQDMSISNTSDKTPTISNVNQAERAQRLQLQNATMMFRDRQGQNSRKPVCASYKKIICCLSMILIGAIIWMVLSASGVLSKGNDHSYESGEHSEPFFPDFTTDPANNSSSSTPTFFSSTSEPSAVPLSELGTFVPTTSALATAMPSAAPIVSPIEEPTLRSTTSPSSAPVPSPTSSPEANFLSSAPLTDMGLPLVGSGSGQRFGYSVALSQDGSVLAIGAPYTASGSIEEVGMVQIFQWENTTWTPRGLPIVGRNSGDHFGSDISLSADGSILVASEPSFRGPFGVRSGNVRTFAFDGNNTYTPVGSDLSGTAATDHFGTSISLSANGKRLAVGAPYHSDVGSTRSLIGSARVYDFQESDGSWQPVATMTGTEHLDWFGHVVELSDDGNILCVGAPRNVEYGGYVQCYNLKSGNAMGSWIRNNIDPGRYDDSFGHVVKLDTSSKNRNVRVAVGAPGKNRFVTDSGIVAVYEYNSTQDTWIQIGEPIAADAPVEGDELGFSLDFRRGVVVVGSPGRAQVDRYVWVDDDGSPEWRKHAATLTGSTGSGFGYAVATRAGRLAIASVETESENPGIVNTYEASKR